MILPFSSSEATLARAGGKGANLAILSRAGFPVPPGFIVSTEAYKDFVAANGLQAKILEQANAVVADNPASLEEASQRIRDLFVQGVVPVGLVEAITDAVLETEAVSETASVYGAVAVRSSATAEDLPGLSFAGQQDTYLNIIGAEQVVVAVKRCWASLWTARAISYRARNHIAPDDVSLAVVVQQMIASETSGILFTANPLTGNRDEMVIDASFGLGEAIVSGLVEPDHYTVDALTAQIKHKRLGAKALQIVPNNDKAGGTHTIQQNNDQRQALDDAQIVALAQLAQRVVAHFGTPQDIEWAWANQQLYLLQSRPITSLYPLPISLDSSTLSDRERLYFSFNSVQGVTDPLTPLGQDAFRLIAGGMARFIGVQRPGSAIFLSAGDRLFIDLTDMAHIPRLRRMLVNILSVGDSGARQTLLRLIETGRLSTTSNVGSMGAILRILRAVLPNLPRIMRTMHHPETAAAPALAVCDRMLEEMRQHAREATDLSALLTVMEHDLERSLSLLAKHLMTIVAPSLISMRFIDTRLTRWLGVPSGAVLPLTRGLPNNVTTQMNLKLWAVAQAMRGDAAAMTAFQSQPIEDLVRAYQHKQLPIIAQQAITTFLDEYGARGLVEIDLGRSRWGDDPTSIFDTLRGYLMLTDPKVAPDVLFEHGAREAERIAADYVARVRSTPSAVMRWLRHARAKILAALIRRLRLLGGLRESPKFYLIRILDAYRVRLNQIGQGLVKEGLLNAADDLFFVPLDVLKAFAHGDKIDLRALAHERRATYQFELGRRRMPRILLGNGETFYEGMTADAADAGTDVLVGQAVSPGVVEGIVRVVLDPRNAQLQPGEILVCPATDPGWTPLFMTAGGLVMEIGGMITHGSVVAREYGIPAVVGVHEATTRLKTGQRVRVDGTQGRVFLKV